MTPDILALARTFSVILSADLDPETMRIVIERNATPEYAGACASHDFTDPNCIMDEAFLGVYNRHPRPTSSRDVHRMNTAWDMAKRHEFNTEAIS